MYIYIYIYICIYIYIFNIWTNHLIYLIICNPMLCLQDADKYVLMFMPASKCLAYESYEGSPLQLYVELSTFNLNKKRTARWSKIWSNMDTLKQQIRICVGSQLGPNGIPQWLWPIPCPNPKSQQAPPVQIQGGQYIRPTAEATQEQSPWPICDQLRIVKGDLGRQNADFNNFRPAKRSTCQYPKKSGKWYFSNRVEILGDYIKTQFWQVLYYM